MVHGMQLIQETYMNGANAVNTISDKVYSGYDTTHIRQRLRTAGGSWLTGTLSEIRICKTSLGATWISTEYNNQNSPSTFYTVGTVESNTSIKNWNGLQKISIKNWNVLSINSIKNFNGLN